MDTKREMLDATYHHAANGQTRQACSDFEDSIRQVILAASTTTGLPRRVLAACVASMYGIGEYLGEKD